jgi:hypothetical protein
LIQRYGTSSQIQAKWKFFIRHFILYYIIGEKFPEEKTVCKDYLSYRLLFVFHSLNFPVFCDQACLRNIEELNITLNVKVHLQPKDQVKTNLESAYEPRLGFGILKKRLITNFVLNCPQLLEISISETKISEKRNS